ncbi:DedA family protein [Sinomonas susongensis]|uniref:DedA family protein n=1 Tax=Sinomonas susongensis TaxID=1324851 RepID=UPI001FE46924|nr:VTT domain-containing protein [Sinomonas susongensis]
MSLDQLLELPFETAVAALFAIVLCRTNGTYWLGRGVAAGYGKTRWARRSRPGKLRRARRLIDRWGPFAIVLTFLTVGLQTTVNFAAGVTRMRLRYYIPATVVGSAAWALIYATVGLAAVELVLQHAAASPWAWGIAAAVLGAVVVRFARAVLRRGKSGDASAVRVDEAREHTAPEERNIA